MVRVPRRSVRCWCGKLWWLADLLFLLLKHSSSIRSIYIYAESVSVHISPWQSEVLGVQDLAPGRCCCCSCCGSLLLLCCCRNSVRRVAAGLLTHFRRESKTAALQLHCIWPTDYLFLIPGTKVYVLQQYCRLSLSLGVVSNAQRATARTRRGMRHGVPRVVSPAPSTHAAGRG